LEELSPNESVIVFDDLEDAFIGIGYQQYNGPYAIYDRQKCIQIFIERDDMSREEAEEFFGFNVEGLWAGENTPVIVETMQPE
jgi:hypothetical protein